MSYLRLKWMNYYDLAAMSRSGGSFRDKCEAKKEMDERDDQRKENNDGMAAD